MQLLPIFDAPTNRRIGAQGMSFRIVLSNLWNERSKTPTFLHPKMFGRGSDSPTTKLAIHPNEISRFAIG